MAGDKWRAWRIHYRLNIPVLFHVVCRGKEGWAVGTITAVTRNRYFEKLVYYCELKEFGFSSIS
jgi:hypothetical protein